MGYKNERRVEMEVTSDEPASVFFGRKVKMQVEVVWPSVSILGVRSY